jgi:hypothetical protein
LPASFNLAKAKKLEKFSGRIMKIFRYWLDSYAEVHKKTWKEDERVFQKYCGSIKSKRLTDLTKADIVKWHQSIGN